MSRSVAAHPGSGISTILASKALSSSALFLFARSSAFRSLALSYSEACSSPFNPMVLPVAEALSAGFCAASKYQIPCRHIAFNNYDLILQLRFVLAVKCMTC
jgi:hypothetical protein